MSKYNWVDTRDWQIPFSRVYNNIPEVIELNKKYDLLEGKAKYDFNMQLLDLSINELTKNNYDLRLILNIFKKIVEVKGYFYGVLETELIKILDKSSLQIHKEKLKLDKGGPETALEEFEIGKKRLEAALRYTSPYSLKKPITFLGNLTYSQEGIITHFEEITKTNNLIRVIYPQNLPRIYKEAIWMPDLETPKRTNYGNISHGRSYSNSFANK